MAQKILEKYNYPYLSIDHLKMGLIRSGQTNLTPYDDEKLEEYLWPIVAEMIKTAIENNQNLVIEGGYIPFNWEKDFTIEYLKKIKYYCLIMTKEYINKHFDDIKKYANKIESRADDLCYTKDFFIKENDYYFEMCQKYNNNYILIDNIYEVEIKI